MMNNNLEFENENPSPDSIENNHPRTNYGEGYGGKKTLEEAAKDFVLSHDFSAITTQNHLANRCFQFGAKWQQQRSYSEEEVIDLIQFLSMNQNFNGFSSVSKETAKSFLEQFKK